MKIGFVGLGKMGARMVQRLLGKGHEIVVFDRDRKSVEDLTSLGAKPAESLEKLAALLPVPRIVWIMVPAGEITRNVLQDLSELLEAGDIVVDGGNSNYRRTIQASKDLDRKGIRLLDIGTSGGVWGLTEGYCLMAGGDESAYLEVEPVLRSLAPADGYARVGPSGAGHFVKMVHNGIEYGLLQAYGEGFDLMAAKKEFSLDLPAIARLWQNGSVIRSWLLDLALRALAEEPGLESVRGYVEDSGEGRWTVSEALDLDVPAPVITLALLARFQSRREEAFSAKLIAALRNQFGGHGVKTPDSRCERPEP